MNAHTEILIYLTYHVAMSWQIIGPGPDEVDSLDNVKHHILTLKPFVQSRLQENCQLIQVLEIYPTGETGYKTAMTLSRLLLYVRKLLKSIDSEDYKHMMRKRSSGSMNFEYDISKSDRWDQEHLNGLNRTKWAHCMPLYDVSFRAEPIAMRLINDMNNTNTTALRIERMSAKYNTTIFGISRISSTHTRSRLF